MTLLSVEDVHVEYERKGRRPVRAVAGVDLEVGRGQIVALVGESGCGKSTLARAVVGLLVPKQGVVRFDGAPVEPLSRGARRRDQVRLQMIFQDPYSSLNPRRRIGAQLLDGQRRIARRGARRSAGELLEHVGLAGDVARRYPHEFSGGQRQRIAIARALATDPALIVADEPVTALDASSRAHVTNLLGTLCREMDMGMLFISHDLALVRHIADVVAVMYLGKIVEIARTDELWANPLHPYTRALMAAVPTADGSGRLPEALAGEVPDPSRPPEGCRFRPRCPLAFERCFEEPTLAVAGGGTVACWAVRDDERSHARAGA